MNKQMLLSENRTLLNQMKTDDRVFLSFLQTAAKYPGVPVAAQTSLYYHAPDYVRVLATKEDWETLHDTTVAPGSMPVPMLVFGEDGDTDVIYGYDVADTVGFASGDSDLLALGHDTYDASMENAMKEALGHAGDATVEEALRHAVQDRIVESRPAHPELLEATAQYVLLQHLGLPHPSGILTSIRREDIDMEAFLDEAHAFIQPIVRTMGKVVHNGPVLGQSEKEEENHEEHTRDERTDDLGEGVRPVRGREEAVSDGKSEGDVGRDAGGREPRSVPDDVPAGDGGEGRPDGDADASEGGRDGDAQEAGSNRVHPAVQQSPEPHPGDAERGDLRVEEEDTWLSEKQAQARYQYFRSEFFRIAFDTDPAPTEDIAAIHAAGKDFIEDLETRMNEGAIWAGDMLETMQGLMDAMEPTPDTRIAEWYASFDPNHGEYEALHPSMTFRELYQVLQDGKDMYQEASISDSETRQALLLGVALANGVSIEHAYNLYYGSVSLSHTPEEFETAEYDKETLPPAEEFVWERRLKYLDVSGISQLADYGLTREEARVLGKLHQDGKYREKIEDFLEDINFHEEAGWLRNGNYSAFMAEYAETTASTPEYGYYLTQRPAGVGTLPEGFVRLEEGNDGGTLDGVYHTAYYDHLLSKEEQERYELTDKALYESRHETIHSFTENEDWKKLIPEDLTFAQAYEKMEAGASFFETIGQPVVYSGELLTRDTYGKMIAEAYEAFGHEMARRMMVKDTDVLKLMGRGFTREVGQALRSGRTKKAAEQPTQEQPTQEAPSTSEGSPVNSNEEATEPAPSAEAGTPAEESGTETESTSSEDSASDAGTESDTEPAAESAEDHPEEVAEEEAATEAEEASDTLAVKDDPVDTTFQAVDLSKLDLNADMTTEAGKHAVFARNLAAILIANHLEATGTQANEEELKVLRAYSGFGGLADAFAEPPKNTWKEEHQQLLDTFSESEYKSLLRSTLTAFYTPQPVVDAITKGLQKMGFTGGNILDPSTGSGRFLQSIPQEMKDKSHLVGVEMDLITARVAKYANPDAQIVGSAFERTNYPEGSFDLAFTNVPFSDSLVIDRRYPDHNYLIHDYFLNRMVDEVRPGGLVVALTSHGSMDKKDETARKDLARKAELLGGFRLPPSVFSASGTDAALTDVLIFRRREKELSEDAPMPDWVHSTMHETGISSYDKANVQMNNHFWDGWYANERFFLGLSTFTRKDRFGSGYWDAMLPDTKEFEDIRYDAQESREPLLKFVSENLEKEIGMLPAYTPAEKPLPKPEQAPIPGTTKPFGYYLENDELVYLRPDGQKVSATKAGTGYTVAQTVRASVVSAIAIREKVQELFAAQLRDCSDEELQDLQAELSQMYDHHVESFGTFQSNRTFCQAMKKDAGWPVLQALELYDGKGKFEGKSAIFTERSIHANRPPEHVDTMQEALAVSMSQKGHIDIPYMSSLTGVPSEEVISQLEYKEIFDEKNGHYVPADEFLSGDIRQKMEDTEKEIQHLNQMIHDVATESVLQLPPQRPVDLSRDMLMPMDDIKEIFDDPALCQKVFAEENRGELYHRLRNFTSRGLDDFMVRGFTSGDPSFREWFDDPNAMLELFANVPIARYLPHDPHSGGMRALSSHVSNYLDYLNYGPVGLAYLKKMLDDGFQKGEYSYLTFKNDVVSQAEHYLETVQDADIARARQQIAHFQRNYEALEAVKPKDLTADEIVVNLGANWVSEDVIQDFVSDMLGYNCRPKVTYSQQTSQWEVKLERPYNANDAALHQTYGTKERDAVKLINAVLNHSQVNVYDKNKTIINAKGNEVHPLDMEKTLLARQKMDDIREHFHEWVFQDEDRRDELVAYYNRHFNNIRPRTYDGSFLTFPGMNPEISLYPHQKDAVARTIFGGNTLLAHVVGAGKTFEMQASAMEAKRLGICHKSMMIMPKHLTEQFGEEFQRLYPNAKILVATKDDLKDAEHKRLFLGKILSQPWDAVVMSYQQFQRIPLSAERQQRYFEKQLDRLKEARIAAKNRKGENFTVKQLAAMEQRVETKIAQLKANIEKHLDNFGLTFEQLGIDRLYVDEAHNYKNLEFYTHLKGISPSHADKTDDLIMKVDYLNDLTDERGVIFATGTPVSNSMAELYTMQRYLKPSRLASQGFVNFDDWAMTFGQEVTRMELKPEGSGYTAKTRFTQFNNLPELISMFHEFADVRTADMLDLDVPESETVLEVAEPSPVQQEMVADLSHRADLIRSKRPMYRGKGEPDPDSTKGYDNMLVITNDGRKLALEPRLCGEQYYDPDYQDTKINRCVANVAKIFHDYADEKLTQVIFSDLGTPKSDKEKNDEETYFNVYEEVKEKLMEKGVPEDQIAFIHDYDSPEKKARLFQKVRQGEIRVVMGSSEKLGVGTNMQDLLVAEHDLDCPWKPSQIEQRVGRIVRQGNKNKKVKIFRYLTKGTFDAYMWQTNERKQQFISQIMTSRSPARNAEDVDELVLDYATAKAACTGNPLFKEQMELQNDLVKLNADRVHYLAFHHELEKDISVHIPKKIEELQTRYDKLSATVEAWKKGEKEKTLTLDGKTYETEEEMGKILQQYAKALYDGKLKKTPMGSYHGLKASVVMRTDPMMHNSYPALVLSGKHSYHVRIRTTDPKVNATRLLAAGINMESSLNDLSSQLAHAKEKLKEAKEEIEKPFVHEEEYQEKTKRLQKIAVQIAAEEAKKAAEQGEDWDDEEEASDSVSRMRVIQGLMSPKEDETGVSTYYLSEASYQYQAHGKKWDETAERKVVQELLHRGYPEDAIAKTVSTYSPILSDEEQAKAFVKKSRQAASCR